MASTKFTDRALPAAELLLADSGDADAASWVDRAGGALRSLRRRQVLYRPGRWITVVHEAEIEWADDRGEELLVAASDGGPPRFWLYPRDPELPTLERVADPAFVAALAERGVVPAGDLDIETVAYRPGRRAVVEIAGRTAGQLVFDPGAGRVEATTGRERVYLKVVRPGRADRVGRRLAAIGGRLPVPACRLCADDLGLIALEGLPGSTLGAALRRPAGAVPHGSAILELLDRLAAVDIDDSPARGVTAKARRQAELLRAVLPDHAGRIDRFVEALGEDVPEPLVTAHNDFHASQLLVDPDGAIVGLLDVDGVAPGQRTDDLATMLGRIWVAGRTASRAREQAAEYAQHLFEAFAAATDPRELCRRTAAVVLGRATGPFRAQQPEWPAKALERVRLAEAWLDAAPRGVPPTSR